MLNGCKNEGEKEERNFLIFRGIEAEPISEVLLPTPGDVKKRCVAGKDVGKEVRGRRRNISGFRPLAEGRYRRPQSEESSAKETTFAMRLPVLFCQILFQMAFGYEYAMKTFTVPVDHFSFTSNHTFEMRYLVNDSHWNRKEGPIFFYTGNEGSIELFANNTGFLWEIAPSFQALVVFAEHRYYGESLPFGNASYSDPKHLGYLTSQQALADYVDLIEHLRGNASRAYRNPVIAFGGSYGGMLAAYLRMKYPHEVAGALAASAPIWQFTGMVPCDVYARIVTADFAAENKTCSKSIRKSWSAIDSVTSKEEGLNWLSKEWKLCKPLKNASDVQELKSNLADVYGSLAMINYPYPTDFLAPVPAHPIREVCKHLQNSTAADQDLLKMLFRGISVFFNYTGKANCLSPEQSSGVSLGAKGWDYQACTEMVMPMCTNGNTDMFEPQEWDLEKYSKECLETWNANPQPFLAEKTYGGKRIAAASNIIFSNGLLDPWAGGGVLKAPSASVTVELIPEGAHHLDLRANDPADPESVRKSRLKYQTLFKKWIREHDKQFF